MAETKIVTDEVLGQLTQNGEILTKDYADKLYGALTATRQAVAQLQDLMNFKTYVNVGANRVLIETEDED